jgi:hypothetical protein
MFEIEGENADAVQERYEQPVRTFSHDNTSAKSFLLVAILFCRGMLTVPRQWGATGIIRQIYTRSPKWILRVL